MEGLKNLGVDIAANSEGYENTRQQIIKEYYGSILLDKILEDEKSMPVQGPTEGNPNDLGGGNDIDIDVGEGAPRDIISGPEEPEDTNEPEEGNEEIDINTEEPMNTEIDTTETRDLG